MISSLTMFGQPARICRGIRSERREFALGPAASSMPPFLTRTSNTSTVVKLCCRPFSISKRDWCFLWRSIRRAMLVMIEQELEPLDCFAPARSARILAKAGAPLSSSMTTLAPANKTCSFAESVWVRQGRLPLVALPAAAAVSSRGRLLPQPNLKGGIPNRGGDLSGLQ